MFVFMLKVCYVEGRTTYLYSCYRCVVWKGEQSICIHVKGVLSGRENKVYVFMLQVC